MQVCLIRVNAWRRVLDLDEEHDGALFAFPSGKVDQGMLVSKQFIANALEGAWSGTHHRIV